jgi:hypothetical protein
MPIRPSELEGILAGKFNFSPARNHSSDHRWYELKLTGLPTILTKISHSRSQIRSNLESKIARQLRVRTNYYRGMISCENDCEDYYSQVTNDPYPPWDVRF